jgi:hypothetical protein
MQERPSVAMAFLFSVAEKRWFATTQALRKHMFM